MNSKTTTNQQISPGVLLGVATMACGAPATDAVAPSKPASQHLSAVESTDSCLPLVTMDTDHVSILRTASAALAFLAQVSGEALGDHSDQEALALLCRVFDSSSPRVISLPATEGSQSPAPLCDVGEVAFPASTDDLDGTWHLLMLSDEFFAAMYEPPQRDIVYPPTSWTIRREGRFAIHDVVRPAFVCPTDEAELCVSWNPRQQQEDDESVMAEASEPDDFFCPDERARPCLRQGYNSELYILDPTTSRTVRIGPLEKQDLPSVTATPTGRVRVQTATCDEVISF